MNSYSCRPAWVEIDCDKIVHNVNEIKRHIGAQTNIIGVIKGDAYGHGSVEIARVLIEEGVPYLAVATIDEGIELRENQIDVPILILGYTCKDQIKEALHYNLSTALFNKEIAQNLSSYAIENNMIAKVHIKINSGMNRVGIRPEEISDFINFLKSLKGIRIEGIFTHFASAAQEDKTDADIQYRKFQQVLQRMKNEIREPFIVHTANSGATMEMSYSHFDAVRPGRLLYGLYPYPDVKKVLYLKPALSVRAKVIQINKIKVGEGVGYEGIFRPDYDTYTAVLPLGFTDGIVSRRTVGKISVVLKGKKRKVIAVCADMCMIDIGPTLDGISVEDMVTLVGEQENQTISVEEIAEPSGESLGGVFTLLNRRLPRIYFKNNKPYLIRKPFEKYQKININC